MGNKKTKRLAGQLLKSYGLSKKFTNRKRWGGGKAKFIVSILSLHKGDLLFEVCTGYNHPVIGFLALNYIDNNKQYSTVLHTVYEGMLLGSGAFSIDPCSSDAETYSAEKHGPVDRAIIYECSDHYGDFVRLKEK